MISTIGLILTTLPLALGATYNVQVGPNGRLAFEPEFVNAHPGDVINFTFNPKNHTVTQSTFDAPCAPAPNGARTGFIPVAPGTVASGLPVRQLVVPEGNAPLWFYCGQTGHCGAGMVFAINPPAEPNPRSFSAFKALAVAQGGAPPPAPSPPAPTFVTPPPPQYATATATVTWRGGVYTTTYTSYDGTPPPTPAPEPVNHKIVVGANGVLNYDPPNIQASVGDTVTFEFRPKNHTVTQSSFLNPCTPFQGEDGAAGFKSGFQFVAADSATFPTFSLTINDTAPIWGYCGQANHCGAGMVFAINAVESGPNNFNAFLELAKRTVSNPVPISGSPTASGIGADPSAPAPDGGALSSARSSVMLVMASVFAVFTFAL